jgi:hypothetical protein
MQERNLQQETLLRFVQRPMGMDIGRKPQPTGIHADAFLNARPSGPLPPSDFLHVLRGRGARKSGWLRAE